ncbi:MAG TPA: mechanosensitive ion channel, partial [Clostridiales bacterium]|nr:mechanosensitive ion channel [Clostridiales bacterium]
NTVPHYLLGGMTLKYLTNTEGVFVYLPILVSLVVSLFALAVRLPVANLLLRVGLGGLRKKKPERYKTVKAAAKRPLSLFVSAVLIYAFYSLGNTVTISILPEDELPKVLVFLYGQTIYRILSTIVLISAFWLLYNVVGISMAALLSVSESKGRKIDANASSYIASGLKVLVAVFGAYFVLTKWGVDVSGLIAGLGIGGLAMALAAKDTASNLFSSISIMLDKPFEIGDTIIIGGIKGKVVSLGLRSSRLEAPDGSIITYPNSSLASAIITDTSKKQSSKIEMSLSVAFSTSTEKLSEFMDEIRRIIREDEDTTDTEPIVYFNSFTASAMQLSIVYEVYPEFEREIRARQNINTKVIEAAEKMEIKLV